MLSPYEAEDFDAIMLLVNYGCGVQTAAKDFLPDIYTWEVECPSRQGIQEKAQVKTAGIVGKRNPKLFQSVYFSSAQHRKDLTSRLNYKLKTFFFILTT